MEPERITKIRAEKSQARVELRELLAGATKDKRPLTDDERGSSDRLTRQLQAIEAELLDHDRHAPAMDKPADAGSAAAVVRQRQSGAGAAGRKFADLFPEAAAQPSPFASLGEYFAAVHGTVLTGAHDPRLAILAAMNESVGSQGGFAVPAPLAAAWLDAGLESEVVRPRATVYPMVSDSLEIPSFDDFDHSGGSIAGFKAYWTGELADQAVTEGKLRKLTLRAKKLLVATQVSNELLADGGQTFADQLEGKMSAAVSWTLDDRFLNGTGAGQPLGLLNDPALITVSKEASQAASTFVLENALKMYERLYPGGFARGVWVVNHSVIPQLYALHLKIKNVAGSENVGGSLTPYFTIAADGAMKLLGLPVITTEKTPALSSRGDVLLADFSQFAVGIRADILLENSRHAGWTSDSTYYRAVLRVEGAGTWAKPLTPKAGSTRSWAVVLEAR